MGDGEKRAYLENLRDGIIYDINRTVDMVCFSLVKSFPDVNEFGLHVQCSCRMISEGRKEVIFASNDRFVPRSTEEWTDDFNWDVQGENLFDEKAKEWVRENKNVFIENYQFNELGDLRLVLSNGDVFEVMVNCSSREAWRFFECNVDTRHFVVMGGVLG